MKPHYRRFKGYRRNDAHGGRPVCYVQMSRAEVQGRRIVYAIFGGILATFGGVALWIMSVT
mgnify:CR=1 FL=1